MAQRLSDMKFKADLALSPIASMVTGPMELEFSSDGELVHALEPQVGFLHRGIEKLSERMPWQSLIPFTDRIDYLSAVHSNWAYCIAVESLASIAVPARAEKIRVVAAELCRISSHLYWLSSLSKVVGAQTASMYILRDRERINDLFEMLAGSRLTYNFLRIGGVGADITAGFLERAYELARTLPLRLKEYDDLLFSSSIFSTRLRGKGILPAPLLIEHGITGPVLRAGGVAFDTRKTSSGAKYYQDFEFSIPVGTTGDCWDRVRVRLEEIKESAKILLQALDKMPDGDIMASVPRNVKIPKGETWAMVESPRGTLGAYVISSNEKYPERVRYRTPSFPVIGLLEILCHSACGPILLDDLGIVVSTLDIMVSEVDR